MTETREQVNAALADARFIELGALSDAAWTATLETWRTTGMEIGKAGMPYANAEWGQPMKLWRTSGPCGPPPLSIGVPERDAALKIAVAWTQAAATWEALDAAIGAVVQGTVDGAWMREAFISEDEICREHPDTPRCRTWQT